MKLSTIGKIVKECWEEIPRHFPNASLDEYAIMPNHFHGIIVLSGDALVRVEYIQPQRGEPQRGRPRRRLNEYQHIIPKSVGSIIRSFKGAITRICRQGGFESFRWQRDYYEHIIRDVNDLARIRRYVIENPSNWVNDDNFPENIHQTRIVTGMVDS